MLLNVIPSLQELSTSPRSLVGNVECTGGRRFRKDNRTALRCPAGELEVKQQERVFHLLNIFSSFIGLAKIKKNVELERTFELTTGKTLTWEEDLFFTSPPSAGL